VGNYLLKLLLSVSVCFSASPGVVMVQPPGLGQQTTWVRAQAGVNEDVDRTVCTMTVNRIGGSSNMHLYCTIGIGSAMRKLYDGDISIISTVGLFLSFGGPVNRVSLMLSRGNKIADQWQMSANQEMKTGVF
jgi:hypothetical protein